MGGEPGHDAHPRPGQELKKLLYPSGGAVCPRATTLRAHIGGCHKPCARFVIVGNTEPTYLVCTFLRRPNVSPTSSS